MNDVIFWYTGVTVWAIIAILVACVCLVLSILGAYTGYVQARTYVFTYIVCKRLAVDRDIEFVRKLRNVAAHVLSDINDANGYHVRNIQGNDMAALLKELEDNLNYMIEEKHEVKT